MKALESGKKKWIVIGGIALLLIAVFFFYRSKSKNEVQFAEVPVSTGDLEITVLATGTVEPQNRLEIKAPVAGRIESILIQEGQEVKKGQIIAWMSSSERAAMLDAARAQGAEAYKKWTELYLATPVMAPISGTIITKNVEPGQTFTTTDAIFVMSDRLTIKAQVDETDISQIKLKQPASITLDAYPTDPIPGQVGLIAFDSKTVNNVTTYIVDVVPKETPDFVRSGMTANVTFQISEKKGVLLVPNATLQMKNGKAQVLVKLNRPPGQETREIQTGTSDGRNTEVIAGLKEGDILLSTEFKLEKNSADSSPFGMPKMPGRRK